MHTSIFAMGADNVLTPQSRAAIIESRLRSALDPEALTIEDESALHAGHEGAKSGGSHFRLHLISRKFEGLNKVARHRLVYDSLHDLMKRDIHALAMTLLSPEEATAANEDNDRGHDSGQQRP